MPAQAPARGSLAVDTHLHRTHEVDLREARDQLAGRLTPGAAGRGGVNDDGGADLGEELGRVRQGAVQNLLLRLRDPAARHQVATHLVEIEHAHGDLAGRQRLDETRGHRRLARARTSSDPDRPARGTQGWSLGSRREQNSQIRDAMRRLGDGLPGRVDDQLRREGGLVRHVDAGYGGAWLAGALIDAAGALPPERLRSRSRATSSGHTIWTSAKRGMAARARSRHTRRWAVASMMTGTRASVSSVAIQPSARYTTSRSASV